MAERIITSLAGLDLSSFCLFPLKMGHSVPHVSHRVFTNLLTEGPFNVRIRLLSPPTGLPPSGDWLMVAFDLFVFASGAAPPFVLPLPCFFQYGLTLTWEYRGSYRSHFLWMTLSDDLR